MGAGTEQKDSTGRKKEHVLIFSYYLPGNASPLSKLLNVSQMATCEGGPVTRISEGETEAPREKRLCF